ncbi:hemagglutinin [Mycoplasmopsis synoviae]|uniref:Hemagglutinin n=1 Tax=Mycoplasmopsis synoviae TaxID=2109 RepID=A0AAX3F1F1_MYCSY|nr:hemagglutinin [Mycoplasmopsis synoviae]UBM43971.1 hemagglutinin [Mycoplasmopsis synoviae]UZW64112.1 hemagglutinin [Mycoplasmopsis synoviae]UZW64817.1 hemagglutinin [Mycoplasmopsis synoviae]
MALYWDGFMPKIVLTDFDKTWGQNTANQTKIRDWFREASNWEGLSDQLTKKLGVERFKNVVLSQPNVTFEIINWNGQTWRVPTVTFNLAAKEGYELIGSTNTIALKIRVVYDSNDANAILFPIQGASSSAVPNRASNPNDATTIKNVNVYLNYTGPAIVLNADLPTVGGQENTSINGTSNVDGTFNTAFRGNPSSGLLFTHRYANPLLKSVINYVNKFDPKFRAEFVTDSKNGVTISNVTNNVQLRPGTLDDLLSNKNKVFLQQIKGDTEAVYFAVNGVTSEGWLNTFLIRIPLTKFVRPLTEFQAQSATVPTQEGQTTQGQENSAGSGALGSTTGTQTTSGGSSQASGS